MFGMLESIGYQAYLEDLKKQTPNADVQGLGDCISCGWCCAKRPCRPTPGEVEDIARQLGRPVKVVVAEFFVIDRFTDPTWFLFPAKTTQKDLTGSTVPAERTFDRGYCIFHDEQNHKCKIYSFRPKQAQLMNCWGDYDETDAWSEELLKQWGALSETDWEKRFGVTPNENVDDYDWLDEE